MPATLDGFCFGGGSVDRWPRQRDRRAGSGTKARSEQQTAMAHGHCPQPYLYPFIALTGLHREDSCDQFVLSSGIISCTIFIRQNQNHYHQMAFVPLKSLLKILFLKNEFHFTRKIGVNSRKTGQEGLQCNTSVPGYLLSRRLCMYKPPLRGRVPGGPALSPLNLS